MILLDNPPAREHAYAYERDKTFENFSNTKKIEELKSSLETWTTTKELHMGFNQKVKAKYPLQFPHQLLVTLFIIRYAVTDKPSLDNLKRLVSSDFIPIQEQVEPNFEFFEPKWLESHVVVNIVEIFNNTIGLNTVIPEKILHTPKHTRTRLKAAVYHTTTKAFIQILLKYGGHPKLPTTKHFDRMHEFLNKRATNRQPTTVTELIFDALPFILKHYMGTPAGINRIIRALPNKATCQSDKWLPSVTMDQFNLSVPVQVTQGETLNNTALSFLDYFNNIFDGTASYDDVITFAPIPEPEPPTEQKEKKKRGGGGGGGGGRAGGAGGAGGGGGRGGGSSSPHKKAVINIERIEQCLSTIDSSIQCIRQAPPNAQNTNEFLTAITGATTEIRNLISSPTSPTAQNEATIATSTPQTTQNDGTTIMSTQQTTQNEGTLTTSTQQTAQSEGTLSTNNQD